MTAPDSALRWQVRLAGDKSVASFMARVFNETDPSVRRGDDGDCYLRWSGFQECSEWSDVLNAAAPLLSRLCGLLNLCGAYVGEVWAKDADLIDESGKRVRGGGILVRMSGTVVRPETLTGLEERGGPDDLPLAARLHELAKVDRTAKALFEVANWRQLGWGDLYLLYELLEDAAGGLPELAALGGTTKKQLGRFTGSANVFRHAKKKPGAKFRPLSLHESTTLIRKLASKWLLSKL